MSAELIAKYLTDRAAFAACTQETKNIYGKLEAMVRALKHNPHNTVITNTEVQFPMDAGGPGGRSFNSLEWPSAQMLADHLKDRYIKRADMMAAWAAIPKELQAGLHSPPPAFDPH